MAGLVLAGALVMAAILAYVPWQYQRIRSTLPPIHDITTDTDTPPAFVAVLPARAAENAGSVIYDHAELPQLQKRAYSDLAPIMTAMPVAKAFDQAIEVARAMPGWIIVAFDGKAGRIEASQQSLWFRFTDDVVIKIAGDEAGSRIDMRSTSRQGRSDYGVNAARIRAYRPHCANAWASLRDISEPGPCDAMARYPAQTLIARLHVLAMPRCSQAPATPYSLQRTIRPAMDTPCRERTRSKLRASLSCRPCSRSALPAASPAQPRAAPPARPPVTVAKPTKQLVADQRRVCRPLRRRRLRRDARARLRLSARIHFKDGQLVKKGDLLFTIDRRPFQAALAQTKASLAQAKANLAFAESDLERGESLVRGTTITQQTLDQRTQASRVAEASVTAQEAAVRQADARPQFTELTAPISGRIGDRRVSIGNLVSGGTTGSTTLLATIASIDPIRFEFTMDEASYLRYLRLAGDGVDRRQPRHDAAGPPQADRRATFTHEGKIDFVDNAIDRSSGTIRGRAEFANPDGTLTPGMFGRIQMPAGPPSETLLRARCRHRHRAGAQVRATWSMPTTWRGRST